MSDFNGLEALAKGAILSPFSRLARLLEGVPPGDEKVIEMTVGDPNEAMPEFVVDRMAEAKPRTDKERALRVSILFLPKSIRNTRVVLLGDRYSVLRYSIKSFSWSFVMSLVTPCLS